MSGISNISFSLRSSDVTAGTTNTKTMVSAEASITRKAGQWDSRQQPESTTFGITNVNYINQNGGAWGNTMKVTLHDNNGSTNTSPDFVEIQDRVKNYPRPTEHIMLAGANDVQKERAATGLCFMVGELNNSEALDNAAKDPIIAGFRVQALDAIENLAREHKLETTLSCLGNPSTTSEPVTTTVLPVSKSVNKPIVIRPDGKGGFIATNQ